jgi:hypothetical protein
MAKSARHRAMPSTPQDRPASAAPASPAATPEPTPPAAPADPGYLITGTRCTAGHVRGQELDSGRLGTVPSRKRARIGFGLVLWCVAGMALLAAAGITSWTWSLVGTQVAALWLAFAAVVVRNSGHRRRCWRTRSWRHAWGGLAPGSS